MRGRGSDGDGEGVVPHGVEGRRVARRVEGRFNSFKSGKVDGRTVDKYREMRLMPSLYKIYKAILARSLEEEV